MRISKFGCLRKIYDAFMKINITNKFEFLNKFMIKVILLL